MKESVFISKSEAKCCFCNDSYVVENINKEKKLLIIVKKELFVGNDDAINTLYSFKHPSLLKLEKHYFENDSNERNLILEFSLDNCSPLNDFLGSFYKKMDFSKNYQTSFALILIGVISGLKYLHQNGKAHGEIKPSSVYLNSNQEPVISAHCLSILQENIRPESTNPEFQVICAPEYNLGDTVTFEQDVFAFGTFIYRLFSKEILFKQKIGIHSYSKTIRSGVRPTFPPHFPPFICDIIASCWNQDPNDRPCFETIERQCREGIMKFFPAIIHSKILNYISIVDKVSPSSSIKKSPPGSPSNTTKEKNLKRLSSIPKKYWKNIEHSIIIQEKLLDLNENNINTTIDWIKLNLKMNDEVYSMICRLINDCVVSRFKKIHLYAIFINSLKPFYCNSELLISITLRFMHLFENYPTNIPRCSFLFWCHYEGIFTTRDLLDSIKYFNQEFIEFQKDICPLFGWFAPIIEKEEPDLYNNIVSYFSSNLANSVFHPLFIDFFVSLPVLKSNNWELYHNSIQNCHLKPNIKKMIIEDDLEGFRNIIKEQHIDLHSKMNGSLFDTCQYAQHSPNLSMYAAVYGSVNIFQYLYMVGINSNAKDKKWRTVSLFAAAGGVESILRSSLQLCSDLDGLIQTALHFHQNHLFPIIKNMGFSLQESDRFDRFPIHVCASSNNLLGMYYCIQNGASINLKGAFGATPLHSAAENGSEECLQLLLSIIDIEFNPQDVWGATPLFVATDKKQVGCIRLLLNYKQVDPNLPNNNGETPFHLAIKGQRIDIVKIFLFSGRINKKLSTKKGSTPLHLAGKFGNIEIFKILLEKGEILPEATDKKNRTVCDIIHGKKELEECWNSALEQSKGSCYI